MLDNARNEAQIRPLLPATPRCLVLVTSRRRLAALDDAVPVSLDVMPLPDAVALFTATAGPRHGATSNVEEIVELCGRLPLAVRVAATRLRHRPTMAPADLAELLRDQQHRLGELDTDQRSLAAAFTLSYLDLTACQQYTFRMLGLHPGADADPYAAAALTGTSVRSARRTMDALLDAHLLEQHAPGRYRFHDLLRAYARQAAESGPAHEREAALGRLFDHYAHTAALAMDELHPYESDERPRAAAGRDCPRWRPLNRRSRGSTRNCPNLLAAAHAAATSHPDHTLRQARTLHRHLWTRAQYTDAASLHHHALELANATGDRRGEYDALHGLSRIHRMQGRHQQAADGLEQALRIAGDIGHRTGELHALNGLGDVHYAVGRYVEGTDCQQRALRIAGDIGHRAGEQHALNGLGHIHLVQGRYGPAADCYQRALDLAQCTGNSSGEQQSLYGLSHIHLMHGRYGPAAEHLTRALRIARDTGHRTGEQNALHGLGHIHRMRGQFELATDCYRQALAIACDTGNRNVEMESRHGLGRAMHAAGHHQRALEHLRRSLDLATELAPPPDQARIHDGLAHTYRALGQHELARHHWQHALRILTSHPVDHMDEPNVTTTAITGHLGARVSP